MAVGDDPEGRSARELEHFSWSSAELRTDLVQWLLPPPKGCESPCTWFNRFFVLDRCGVAATPRISIKSCIERRDRETRRHRS